MLYVLVGDVYLMFVYIDLRSLYVIFRFAFYSFFLFFIFFLLFFFFLCCFLCVFFFFFQAEDGIRDADVTGVQTCALPISSSFDELRMRAFCVSRDYALRPRIISRAMMICWICEVPS